MSIDCLYKNSPHVEVQASPTVLQPKKSVDFKILFYPKGESKFRELIPFDINGLHTVNVEVLGEGIRVKGEFGHCQ